MLHDYNEWLDTSVRLINFGDVKRGDDTEFVDSWELLLKYLYEAATSEADAALIDDAVGLPTGGKIRAIAGMASLVDDRHEVLRKKLGRLATMVDKASAEGGGGSAAGPATCTTVAAAEEKDAEADFKPIDHAQLRSMDEIFGAEREKRDLVVQFVRPIAYDKIMVPFNSMLMYGPPGTGKTFFAMAAARTMQATTGQPVFFFAPSSGSYQGKFLGATQKRLRAVFRTAHETAKGAGEKGRSLLFMDEFESLAKSRAKNAGDLATSASVPELLQLTDGAASYDNVILMAATNLPWMIDSAMMRRFDARLFVDLPTRKARKLAILNVLRKYFNVYDAMDGDAIEALRTNSATCDPSNERHNNTCKIAVGMLVMRTGFDQTYLPRLEAYLKSVGVQTAGNRAYATWYESHFGKGNRNINGQNSYSAVPYSMSDIVKVVERAVNLYANQVISAMQLYNGKPVDPATMQHLDWSYTVGNEVIRFQDVINTAMAEYPSTIDPAEYAALVAYYVSGEEPPSGVRLQPYVEKKEPAAPRGRAGGSTSGRRQPRPK